jgi:hypothetical protein
MNPMDNKKPEARDAARARIIHLVRCYIICSCFRRTNPSCRNFPDFSPRCQAPFIHAEFHAFAPYSAAKTPPASAA